MSIYNLVYRSHAQFDPNSSAGLEMINQILANARRCNVSRGVTGALLFTEGTFVQALEGDREHVRSTYERILGDPRHGEVEVLSTQFTDRRRFKEWSMAFVGDSEGLRTRFKDAPLASLGKQHAGDALLDFMLELARADDPRRSFQ